MQNIQVVILTLQFVQFCYFCLPKDHGLCYCLLWNSALESELWFLYDIRKHDIKFGNWSLPYCPTFESGEYCILQREVGPSLSLLFS